MGEVAGDCGLGFSIIKRALLIKNLGAAMGYGNDLPVEIMSRLVIRFDDSVVVTNASFYTRHHFRAFILNVGRCADRAAGRADPSSPLRLYR